MKKFLVWLGALFLAAALATGAWWAWPILFPALPAGWLSTLAKADAALVQGRPDQARVLLETVPETLPVSGWLQWEKRVNAVAAATGAWKWASKTAAQAQAAFPGNAELTAFAVWTLLKDGRAAEASALAEKVLPGTRWSDLAVQASVEALALAPDWASLREMLAQPSADAFGRYKALSRLNSDPLLQKNALLTALAQGKMDEARDHLGVLTPQQRDQPPFDQLQALMAYDQGDWTRAAALLRSLSKSRPETLMVLADVYLHLGNPAQARIIYDQLLADDEFPSGALVVNRATLALDDDDPAGALALLTRAPDFGAQASGSRIRLLTLEARFRLGETEPVRKALDALVDQSGETSLGIEAQLLKGRLFPDLSSRPLLSSLLHRHPEYSPLAERLAWLLLVDQDYEGVHRVLALHEAALKKQGQTPPWWLRELQAFVLASEDALPEASEAFDSVPPAWRDAPFYANWALVAQIQGQRSDPEARKPYLDSALERLTKALDLLPPNAAAESLHRRSLWLTRRGELQNSLLPLQVPSQRGALRSAATEDFRQAVKLDPDNLRASFLLRQATVNQDSP